MKRILALGLTVIMCLVMLSGCNETKDVISDVEPTTVEVTIADNDNTEVPIRLTNVRYSFQKSTLLGEEIGAMLVSYKNVLPDKDIIDAHFTLIAKDERGNEIVNSETKMKEFSFYSDAPVKAGEGSFFQIVPTGFDLGETYDVYVSSVTFSDGTEWIAPSTNIPAVTVKRNFLPVGEIYENDVDKSVYDFQDTLISNLKSYGLQYDNTDPASGLVDYNFYYNDFCVSYGIDPKTKKFNGSVSLEYQAFPTPLELQMDMLEEDELKAVQDKIEKYYYALFKTIFSDISDEEISDVISRNEYGAISDTIIRGYKVNVRETFKLKEQKAQITISKKED